MNEIVKNVLWLLAGCGVFIAGMKMMSEGLEKCAGRGLRKLFDKISNNRLAGYGIGAGVTCVIQSSSATSVMTIGFVNAGIMSLFQASAIILGAKLGTTITGILVSLSSFKIDAILAAVALVGIFMMMFAKRDLIKNLGGTLAGFGLIFCGMNLMSGAFGKAEMQDVFSTFFVNVKNPLLLILIGTAFTALLQSSSATIGIFISMIGAGLGMSLEQGFFLAIGANIGTCITAVIASIGASTDARRVAFLHVFWALIGTFTVGMLVWAFDTPIADMFRNSGLNSQWQLSLFNVGYNLIYTLALLPFVGSFVKLSQHIIKDKKKDKEELRLYFVDDRILQTPQIAVSQIKKEVLNYADIVKRNLIRAKKALIKQDLSEKALVLSEEVKINYLERGIINYLIRLSSVSIGDREEIFIGTLHHVVSDLERIGDHAENFLEMAVEMVDAHLVFSDEATSELEYMFSRVEDMYDKSISIFDTTNQSMLSEVTELEEEIDRLKIVNGNNHIRRLNDNVCSVESGTYYYEITSELERIADHLNNIAYSILSPIGSKFEATQSMDHERGRPAATRKKPLPPAGAKKTPQTGSRRGRDQASGGQETTGGAESGEAEDLKSGEKKSSKGSDLLDDQNKI